MKHYEEILEQKRIYDEQEEAAKKLKGKHHYLTEKRTSLKNLVKQNQYFKRTFANNNCR